MRIIGLGDYQVRINGSKISALGINQPWSQYEKRLYFRDFDVTRWIRGGDNCIGVELSNSFWNNPNAPSGRYNKDGPQRKAPVQFALRAELNLYDQEGDIESVWTDESWKWMHGPIVFSHIYAGEDFEPCLYPQGWELVDFNDSEWKSAIEVQIPTPVLSPQDWQPFAKIATFKPQSVQQVAPTTYLYRFPQNCSAQLKVRLSGGTAGSPVSFLCSEHAKSRILGHYAVETRLAQNGKRLDHQWQSFYLGMQFVEVTGAVPHDHPNPSQLPVIETLDLVHVRTNVKRTGAFKCSSDLYNQTLSLVNWAIESNMSHVFTDCPHREKLGWLECSHLMIPSLLPQYDCHSWLQKIQRDIQDAQLDNGKVLTVAPSYPAGKFSDGFDWTVEWGAAATILPWILFEWYGNVENLRRAFDSMRRFVDHVSNEARDGAAPGGLGDWYDYGHGFPPGPSRFTPPALSATAMWALCARTVADAATALGQADEASHYAELYREIGTRFRDHFQFKDSKRLKHLGSPQCANAMAIVSGVVPHEDHPGMIREIIEDLEARKWQQTAGDIGHAFLIRALASAGRSDILHRIYSRTEMGSYGGILERGLTSMPETWDAIMDGDQSLNHCMLGHVVEWFYGYVGGIRQNPGSVGWKEAVIHPFPGPIAEANCRIKTPLGFVESHWTKTTETFTLKVNVPKKMNATAIMPSGDRIELAAGRSRHSEPL